MTCRLLVSFLLLAGCSGDDDDDDAGDGDADADADADADGDADADADGDADVPAFDTATSFIRVLERGSGTGDEFGGWVSIVLYAQPFPDPHVEVLREGACRMRTFEPVLCDPWCDAGLCVAEDVCTPYPELLDAGTVTVDGLEGDFTATFTAGVGYAEQGQFGDNVFDDGAGISLSATGAAVPAFSVSASGVAPLISDLGAGLDVTGDGELELSWEPGAGNPDARVRARLITDRGHGPLPPVIVECDSADDGSMIIPAAMAQALRDPANWSCGDCFSSTVERYTRTEVTAGAFDIELVVAHQLWVYLQR